MIKNARCLITCRPERCRVPLLVQLEAIVVDSPIEVQRQLRDPGDGPALHQRDATLGHQPAGHAKLAIEPGVEQRATIDLDAELSIARSPQVGLGLQLEAGRIRMATDHAKWREPIGSGRNAPGHRRAFADQDVAPGRGIPGVGLGLSREAHLAQSPGDLRGRVVGRRTGLDEVHKIIDMIIATGHHATVAGRGARFTDDRWARHPTYCHPLPARSLAMDSWTVAALILGLLIGLLIGALASLLLGRSRKDADRAQAETLIAEARGETADAKAEAATAQVEAAEVSAAMAKALAERHAAVERAQEIAADRQAMLDQFKIMSTETLDRQSRTADAQAEARLKATELLLTPVRAGLERFDRRLSEVEKERVAMVTDLRSHVRAVQETGETLRKETATLVTALRKPQTRGAWGETQLKRAAEIAGMIERCDFDVQHTARADDRLMRPDMRVHLAGGKYLFVDSKVPLTGFLDAQETDDDHARAEHLSSYARNIRHHIDQLSAKQYWKAADTPEFVVLFLPSEAFFAAALELIPDLYDYAAARDVVLATPTTLIALLRAVAYGWRQAALAESAAEVFKLGRDLHEKLGLMGNRLDKLGRALRTSVNAYNETIATVEGTVLVRARKFRDLQVSERDLTGLSSVDDPVRQISAGELVENAVQVKPMVGRGSRRRRLGGMPESNELVRPDPDLIDLMDSDNEDLGPDEE